MASSTEEAIKALLALLVALAALPSPVLPAPLRNEDLAARLDGEAGAVQKYLNLWDGSQIEREDALGADTGGDYGITHQAKIEWVCAGGTKEDREAAFDAGLVAINDALQADRQLNHTVDFAEMGNLQGPGSGLVTDGVPGAKGVEIPVNLIFRSTRPF